VFEALDHCLSVKRQLTLVNTRASRRDPRGIPQERGSAAALKGHGDDLAISEKESADYSAIVSGEAFYVEEAVSARRHAEDFHSPEPVQ
jgi:hypothetical protein